MSKATSADRERRDREWLLAPDGDHPAHESARVNTPLRCVVYDRRSEATEDSTSLSRQQSETEEYIRRIGGAYRPDSDIYTDDDISASKRLYRDGMQRLLMRVKKENDIDRVVVLEVSRWTRVEEEYDDAAKILRAHGVDLISVTEPQVSLYGLVGATLARYPVHLAAQEAKKLSIRSSSSHRHRAQKGVHRGGQFVWVRIS